MWEYKEENGLFEYEQYADEKMNKLDEFGWEPIFYNESITEEVDHGWTVIFRRKRK